MLINFDKKAFLKALAMVEGIPATITTNPITEYLLFETKEETVKISANNTQTSVAVTMHNDDGCIIVIPGAICIQAANLFKILKVLDGDSVAIATDGNTVTIASGKSKFKYSGMPADNFPEPMLPAIETSSVGINGAELSRLLKTVIPAMGINHIKPELNGVYMNIEGGEITFVGCDSFRIHKISAAFDSTAEMSAIIPQKAVLQLSKLLPTDTNVTIVSNAKKMALRFDNVEIGVNLFHGSYIEYKRLLGDSFQREIKVDIDALSSMLRRAAIITDVSKNNRTPLTLKISGQTVICSAKYEMGTFDEELEATVSGATEDEFIINVNTAHLSEGLAALKSSVVSEKGNEGKYAHLSFNGPFAMYRLTADGSEGRLDAMPIRAR